MPDSQTPENADFPTGKTPENAPKKRGRPADPNKINYRTMGLRPMYWEYLRQWATPEELESGHLNPALERAMEHLVVFAPCGPTVGKPRDEKGRFLPERGTSRNALTRRRRRQLKERETDGE